MIAPFASPRLGWIALGLGIGAILATQVWAGLALRGLYADGAFYAEQLLLRHEFTIAEPSRWTSEALMQAPVILAIRLGRDSPDAVALAFSLSTNLMPLALSLAALAVLPAADRAYGLFPLAIFLAASMTAAFASVAAGPMAAAYAWLLLMLILFGPFTVWRLAGILLLALGALRLHEAMAFLGPILAAACLWRARSAPGPSHGSGARVILRLAAALILLGSAVAIHDGLYPQLAANRASSLQDLIRLRWLYTGPVGINVMGLIGLDGLLALAAPLLRRSWQPIGVAAGMGLLAALAVLALALPPNAPAAFAARDNACLLSAPAMLLLLWLKAKGRRLPAATLTLTAMLALTTATADGAATAGWLGYSSAMRAALASRRGILPWQEALATLPAHEAQAVRRYAWPWTSPLMSFWLAPGPAISTLIANPAGVTWQPFDPEMLRSALSAKAPAPTRPAFVALLAREPVRWSHPVGLGSILAIEVR